MLKVVSTINKVISEQLNSSCDINNAITGADSASSPTIVDEMITDHSEDTSWVLDATSGPTFSLDVISLLNVATPSEIKFLHIQCHKKVLVNGDTSSPVRFDVAVDTVSLGSMSQLQFANCEGFIPANITISNVNVQTGDKAVLTVVFGVKK